MFLKYRQSTSATVPGATTAKETPLTNLEMDGNFKSISNAVDDLTNINTIVDNNTLNATVYPLWSTAAGYLVPNISTTKIRYNPSTDTLTCINFAGNASTVTTNANLTGMVTSVGNATTVVTNANLTGGVTSVGNATTVVTNANLTGEVTSVGNATSIASTVITSKILTGYVASAGVVAATDTIVQAIGKLAANDATNANLTGMVTSVGNATTVVTNANLTGEVTSVGNATTVTNSAVIGKVLTSFTSGTGTITAADSILTAVQKLYGNDALKAPLTSPTLTTPSLTASPAVDNNSTLIASTAYVIGQLSGSVPLPLADAITASAGTSTRIARQDHVHPDVRPAFRAHLLTTDQTLTSAGAVTTVTFNTKTFDTVGTAYNTGTYRWTPGVVGYYHIMSHLQLAGGAMSSITIQIFMNGSLKSTNITTGTSLNPAGIEINDIIQTTAVGDYFEIKVSVTGSSPTVTASAEGSYFSGVLVSKG